MKIILESHAFPEVRRFMSRIETAAKKLGHPVEYWKGLFWNNPQASLPQFPPPAGDLVFLWNGVTEPFDRFVDVWHRHGAPVIRSEFGWFPHGSTWQVDHKGVNAAASWSNQNLPFERKTRVTVKNKDEVLVLLQIEGDTQLLRFNPWFDGMKGMLHHLIDSIPQRIVVRQHPNRSCSAPLKKVVDSYGKCSWDDSKSFQDALSKYDLIVTINSSAGVEALAKGKVVFCLGQAVYRVVGAVVCLEHDVAKTKHVFTHLDEIPVWKEGQQAVVKEIVNRQWTDKNFEDRLEALLKGCDEAD